METRVYRVYIITCIIDMKQSSERCHNQLPITHHAHVSYRHHIRTLYQSLLFQCIAIDHDAIFTTKKNLVGDETNAVWATGCVYFLLFGPGFWSEETGGLLGFDWFYCGFLLGGRWSEYITVRILHFLFACCYVYGVYVSVYEWINGRLSIVSTRLKNDFFFKNHAPLDKTSPSITLKAVVIGLL